MHRGDHRETSLFRRSHMAEQMISVKHFCLPAVPDLLPENATGLTDQHRNTQCFTQHHRQGGHDRCPLLLGWNNPPMTQAADSKAADTSEAPRKPLGARSKAQAAETTRRVAGADVIGLDVAAFQSSIG